MKNLDLVPLDNKELMEIGGGHKSHAYYFGTLAASNVLFLLGLFSGISEGFDEGMK